MHNCLWVVAVDVEDRSLDSLGEVGRVDRATRGAWWGRETNLVVDNHVDGTAGAVAAQLREVEGFSNNTLTDHCGVTVDEDRQDREAVWAAVDDVLLSADDAFEDWVYSFEVGRVSGQVDLGRVAGLGSERAFGAEVVLHVTGTLDGRCVNGAFELAENLSVGLACDVGEHVEAAAVSHTDGGFVEACICGVGDDRVKQWDQGFATLEREALLTDVLGLQEGFERFSLVELTEDANLFVAGRLLVWALKLGLEPFALFWVLDVHVLDAGGAAVSVTQDTQDVAQRETVVAAEPAGDPFAVKIPQRQAVGLDVKVWVEAHLVGQRVGVRDEVARRAVGLDELLDASNLVDLEVGINLVVDGPADRHVWDAQLLEYVVPELV